MDKEVDQRSSTRKRSLDAARSDDRRGRGHDRVGRVPRRACSLCRGEGWVADQIDFCCNSDVEHGAIVFSRRLMHERKREIGLDRGECEIEHRIAWTLVTCVFGSMTD